MKKNSPGCRCCCSCRNCDVVLLYDLRTVYIGNAMSIFTSVLDQFDSDTCQFAAAYWKDFPDPWGLDAAFTSDNSAIQTIIDDLPSRQSGQTDTRSAVLTALNSIATGWVSTLGGRTDPEVLRVIIYAGQSYGYEGGSYPTVTDTWLALQNAGIVVVGLNFNFVNQGIDGASQAVQIVSHTEGELYSQVTADSWEEDDDIKAFLCDLLGKHITVLYPS